MREFERQVPRHTHAAELLKARSSFSNQLSKNAETLSRSNAAAIAEMVSYYQYEASRRTLERGKMLQPSTDQYPKELLALGIDQEEGQKIISAIDNLYIANLIRDSYDIRLFVTPVVGEEHKRVPGIWMPPTMDSRALEVMADIYGLAGVEPSQFESSVHEYRTNVNSPFLGFTISEVRTLEQVGILAVAH